MIPRLAGAGCKGGHRINNRKADGFTAAPIRGTGDVERGFRKVHCDGNQQEVQIDGHGVE